MKIRVKLFALLRDRAGTPELELELPPGATVAEAAEALLARFPALREHAARVRFAVNLGFEKPETALREGDELAVIPPVSGG